MRPEVAVFPVAGLGTRILPASKAVPKELLPVLDRPLLQYAVEEAIAAGCRTLVFVLNREKLALVDYFDRALLLEQRLAASGKEGLAERLRRLLPEGVHSVFVLQPEPLGLGHAVLCAEPVIAGRPFAVLLPDELLAGGEPPLAQLASLAATQGGAAIGVMEVVAADTPRYGIIAGEAVAPAVWRVRDLVEKPPPGRAPSRLAAIGRYVLPPVVLPILASLAPGAQGEIQLSDAIAELAQREAVFALELACERYDCGQLPGWLAANLRLALAREELRPAVEAVLAGLR